MKIEAAIAKAVAIPQNWELATGEEVVVHVELNAARFGSELRDVAAIGFAAEEAKVKSMIERWVGRRLTWACGTGAWWGLAVSPGTAGCTMRVGSPRQMHNPHNACD